MTVPKAELIALRERVVGIQAAVDSLEHDLQTVQATLACKAIDIAALDVTAKRLHHDHQGVRQMVMCMMDELDRLVPLK